MHDNHKNANQTPAQQRPRRGPAFLLNQTSTRSSSGSQFASPPRFLLSQNATRVDGGSQFRHSAASSPFKGDAISSTPRRSLAAASGRADDLTIDDDASSEGLNDEIGAESADTKETRQDVDMFTELDNLFASARDSNKRRRIVSPQSKTRLGQPSHGSVDEIQDSGSSFSGPPPSPSSVETSSRTLESPFLYNAANRQSATFETPAPIRHKRTPDPKTPSDA